MSQRLAILIALGFALLTSVAFSQTNASKIIRGEVIDILKSSSDNSERAYLLIIKKDGVKYGCKFAEAETARLFGKPVASVDEFDYLKGKSVLVTIDNLRDAPPDSTVAHLADLVSITLPIVVSGNSSLDQQARRYSERWLETRYKKCGEYYRMTLFSRNSVRPTWWIPQIVNPPSARVEGSYVPPRQLSPADKLNGVDPQPIEWDGKIHITFGPYRTKTTQLGQKVWTSWADSFSIEVPLMRKKGEWSVTTRAANFPRLFECKDISPDDN